RGEGRGGWAGRADRPDTRGRAGGATGDRPAATDGVRARGLRGVRRARDPEVLTRSRGTCCLGLGKSPGELYHPAAPPSPRSGGAGSSREEINELAVH